MNVVKVQFTPWDRAYDFLDPELGLQIGDKVVVKTELGMEIGVVIGLGRSKCDDCSQASCACAGPKDNKTPETEEKNKELKEVIRKATAVDLEKVTSKKERDEAVKYCKDLVEKHGLEMKLVDAHFSFDGTRITFAFIADGRVDFRELVKDLTRHFNRTIRLHQIGIRDEAKIMGDYGHCGRRLCCKTHLRELVSITSEMAEEQQVVHRGSERISGICGRLMCCLAYEELGYHEAAQKLPAIGTRVSHKGKRGIVVGHRVLKHSVEVEFPGEKGESSVIQEIEIK